MSSNDNTPPPFNTNTSLVSETQFTGHVSVDEVVEFLRESKTTGQLTIHLHQGGIQRVKLLEKSPVDLVE